MKNRDFPPISRYVSETIRDTAIEWNAIMRIGNLTQAFEWYHFQ